MRILVDARTVRENPSGVATVIINLLKRLEKHPDVEIIALTQKGIKQIPGLTKIVIHETSIPYQFVGIKRFFFEQFVLPSIIKKYQPDIVHFMDSFGVPYFGLGKIRVVLTVHDLIPMTKYRELMGLTGYFWYKISILRSLKRADKIICISEFTRNDLLKFFSWLDSRRIKVIPNGLSELLPLAQGLSKEKILKKLAINRDYILYLGGFSPRKNLLRLIEAFMLFNKKNGYRYQLVLPGRFSPKPDIKKNLLKMRKFISQHRLEKQVLLVDFVSEEEKVILLQNASFFVYISLYEGFGLPVLEALSLGTPVLTSKESVMEEIAGDYALYADPKSIDDIVEKMALITTQDKKFKTKAEAASKLLLKKFNWEKTAESYYREYKNLLR
jgi:glycosyltransferase involved in cell wall biosynthesis